MADFNQAKKDIVASVYENSKQEILGGKLQEVLLEVVDVSEIADQERQTVEKSTIARVQKTEEDITLLQEGAEADKKEIAQNTEAIARHQVTIDGHTQSITDILAKDAEQDTEIGKKANKAEVDAKNKEQDEQIEALISRSDVVDVVADKAALDAYDVSTITINDVIKVLKDESRNNEITYYRLTSLDPKTWTFIGSLGEVYTKGQVDAKFTETNDKVQANTNALGEKANKTYVDGQLEQKADKVDVNEYNISAINGATYASLQEALTALDAYLTAKGIAKSVGVKVTYVQTDVMRAKTFSFVKMGRFADVANWADEPDGGYIRSQAEAAGAVWEGLTKTWLYNGLHLSEKEMIATLVAGRPTADFNAYLGSPTRCPMARVRTNLPSMNSWYNNNIHFFNLRNAFYQNTYIEHIRISDSNLGRIKVDDIYGGFLGCTKAKKIVNADGTSLIMDISRCTNIAECFLQCGELEELFLMGLKADLSLEDSPKLSIESVEYIVGNRAESNPITFTLNGAVFDKLTPTFINDALANKQITIKRA